MEIESPHLSVKDIFAILVSTSSDEAQINVPAIIQQLKESCAIDSDRHDRLLLYYGDSSKTIKDSKRNFHSFIRSIAINVPFYTLCNALKQVGYDELSQKCVDARLSKQVQFVSRGVFKVEYPNEEELHLYYVKEKSNIDNNIYKNGARVRFSDEIASLKAELRKNNIEDTTELQFIVDKMCVLYFLLSQQYASPCKVAEVLMEMRKVIPHNINRMFFNIIFHSYMAFNCASSGEAERAELHLKKASEESFSCAKGFVRILVEQWRQYVNNILYRNSQCRDKSLIAQARLCFENIQQCLQDVWEWDERHIWKTISVLDMVRATVGITPRLEMCDIENIDDDSISQAESMIKLLKEPREIRRKMYYHIVLARVHEQSDLDSAMTHITVALELAPDGCYDKLEKRKILKYEEKLLGDRLPRPSI